MTKGRKGFVLTALVGLLVLGFAGGARANHMPGGNMADEATGGGLEAAAINQLGDTTVTPPLTDVLDLPALNVQEDAEGRIVMDLPGLKLVGKPKAKAVDDHPAPAPSRPGKLPVTGVNVGDLFAMGLAALSGGGVLLRRLRVSLAS